MITKYSVQYIKLILSIVLTNFSFSQNSLNQKEILELQSKAIDYTNQGKTDSSIVLFQEVNTALFLIKDTSSIIYNNCKLANVYINNNKTEKAFEILIFSLKLSELTNKSEDKFVSILHLANFYIQQKDSIGAKKFINLSDKIYPEIKNDTHLSFYYNVKLAYKIYFGKIDDSLFDIVNKSIEICSKNHDTINLIYSIQIKSILFLKNNDFENGIDLMNENIKLAKKKKYYRIISGEYLNLGWIYEQKKNYKLAYKYNLEARNYAELSNDLSSLSRAYLHLAVTKRKNLDYKNALEHFIVHYQLKDSLNQIEKIKYIDELSIKYKTEKKEQEIKLLNVENELKNIENEKQKKNQIIIVIVSFFLIFTISIIFFFFFKSFKQKQRIKLEKTEKEKVRAELIMLKNQISPHVMFNSLNTIYFQLQEDPNYASAMILKFSDLLRFQLYECNEDYIKVKKEIEYIKDFVNFHQLRKSLRCKIELKIDEDIEDFNISPLLIIPLLENAFKYVSNEKDNDNYIIIEIKKRRNILYFNIENTTFENNSSQIHRGGIGLQNLKNRLDLMYHQKHKLRITKKNRIYRVNLLIYV